MAILLMEGFEGYANSADIKRRYLTNSASVSFVTGRDGIGQSFTLNFNSANCWLPYPTSDENLTVGFGYKIGTSVTSRDIMIITSENGVTEQIVLRNDSGGNIYLDRGATNLASYAAGLLAETWYYFEIEILFSDTVGTYDVYLNGGNVITGTGADTRAVTGENSAAIKLQGGSSSNRHYDDLVVIDGTGADQTTRIGPCFIETVIPDSDGTTVNFTPSAGSNWQNVDDGNAPDDDSTYNSSSTATDKDLYGMAALTGSVGTVYAVMVRNYVRTVDAGTRGIKAVARSSVTEVDGTEDFIDQSYVYVDHIYENDPNGGGAWTESSVNAAEFGLKITT